MLGSFQAGDIVERTGESAEWVGVYTGHHYTVERTTADGRMIVLQGIQGAEWLHRGFRLVKAWRDEGLT